MRYRKVLSVLIVLIICLSVFAGLTGILSDGGPGPYTYTSIRQHEVLIYGKGLYRDMSAEVAPQGIAQDYITVFIGVPLLLLSYYHALKGSLRARLLLAGTLKYFLITYLFYTVMAMYNSMFPVYILLLGCSFYGLIWSLADINIQSLPAAFSSALPNKRLGLYLVFMGLSIMLLWLSVILPPMLDGSVVPLQVEHYTTLIVQGLDLGILLPGAIITGLMFYSRKQLSYLLAPVYFVFLSILMTALTAKVIAMWIAGSNVIPVIFIIPSFNIACWFCTILILKNCRGKEISS